MTSSFKPLLADTCEDLTKLRFPVLVSPKLDGIRCVKLDGKALTRKLKPVPNDYVRQWVETNLPDGIDGELMLRDHRAPFSDVSSAIMGKKGEPDFVFNAFDLLARDDGPDIGFEQRFGLLRAWVGPGAHHLALVPHVLAETPGELQEIVDAHVDLGYEGSMVRAPQGRYKFGRSTVKEGILLKIKSFVDEEAQVLGFVERFRNENEATTDALGHVKRSSSKAGKIPDGVLGAIRCRTIPDGVEFEVGTGFTEQQRKDIWETVQRCVADVGDECFPPSYSVLKYKHQPPPGGRPAGVAPRFPVSLGFRED